MAWNYTTSKNRIQKHLDSMGEIKVEKLVRDADLNNLLSETCCREIYGSHVYVTVSNFAHLASGSASDENRYKELIQSVHVYQREVSRIVEGDGIFDGVRIHFQGPKLHALFYRPIDDSSKIAVKAVLLQLVLKDFTASVFNPAFPEFDDFKVAGGADIGDAIGTRNGSRDERELLFLGAPANHAAKIISSHGRLRLTKRVYDDLPEDLQDLCGAVAGETDLYQVQTVMQANLNELTKKYGVGWNRAASQKRIEADKEQFPLDEILYSGADKLIDIDDLTIRNNKRVLAASVFGDTTGFTAYIGAAITNEQKRERLREFHAIRKEVAEVMRSDFNGIRVQFQGDRIQGIVHLPKDDAAGVAAEAVDAAVGLQSSMEKSLKDCLPAFKDTLFMAVGVDQGTTLVTKLGTRGHRDRICLGEPVEDAAGYEERCENKEIGVSKAVYDELPARLKSHFSHNPSRGCYVAVSLTADKVELAEKASSVYAAGAVYVSSSVAGTAVSAKETPDARRIIPAKSYAP